MSDRSFCRAAALVAVASLPVALANLLTIGIAVRWNLDAFSNPLLLVQTGSSHWWRVSMIFDLFGYYLMVMPILLVLWPFTRTAGARWADLSVLLLVAYCLIGAIGAAILTTAIP